MIYNGSIAARVRTTDESKDEWNTNGINNEQEDQTVLRP